MPGERRGGRQKGTPNKATRDIKELAGQYTPEAIRTLVKIMRESKVDTAKISAAKELLDRGWGKAPQTVATTIKDERLVARMPAPAKDAEEWVNENAPQVH